VLKGKRSRIGRVFRGERACYRTAMISQSIVTGDAPCPSEMVDDRSEDSCISAGKAAQGVLHVFVTSDVGAAQ
jgi:hypothetical protein